MDYKSLMERDGFILVKNVFSREEIINLKDLLKSQIDTKGLKRSKNQLGTDLLNAAVEAFFLPDFLTGLLFQGDDGGFLAIQFKIKKH